MSLLVIETLLFFASVSAVNSASSSQGKAPVGISAEQVEPRCLADRLPATFLEAFDPVLEFPLRFPAEAVEGIANFETLSVFSLNIYFDGCLRRKYATGQVPDVDVISADLLIIDCLQPILIDLTRKCALQTREAANVDVLVQTQGKGYVGVIETWRTSHQPNDHTLVLYSATGIENIKAQLSLNHKVNVRHGALVLNPRNPNLEKVIQYNPPLNDRCTVEVCEVYKLEASQLNKRGFSKNLTTLRRDNSLLVLLKPTGQIGLHMLLKKIENS